MRGGGDLASGVALRLQRAGLRPLVTELARPLAVRRTVSFSEAVYEGTHTVEGVTARRVDAAGVPAALHHGEIPVLVDPEADVLRSGLPIPVVIDARLNKTPPSPLPVDVALHIGLGPGFHAGRNCDAAIETRRSHTLGRVYWDGGTQADSGQPEGDPRRVLRAPAAGTITARAAIGDTVEAGQVVALIDGQVPVVTPLAGMLRGLIRGGLRVSKGLKIGDVDPRGDPAACFLVSDKALAVGGGALEAVLTREDIRAALFAAPA